MPRSYKMSFEPARGRWSKLYKGTRYRVSCEELGCPISLEASYQSANKWWENKLAELTAPNPALKTLASLDDVMLATAIEKGSAAKALSTAKRLQPATFERPDAKPQLIHIVAANASKLLDTPLDEEKTLGKVIDRFLSIELARGKAPGTFGDLAQSIRKLQNDCRHLRATLDATTISETTVTDFYLWLRDESGSAVQSKLWGYFRRLVRFCAGQRLCPIPINLDDKIFSFDGTAKKIKTYSTESVKKMIGDLPDRLKLYAYLALNCGMLGVDMAELRRDEYQNGRITRQRSKTKKRNKRKGDNDNVPTVEYLLWPETKALLNQWQSDHEELVLTGSTGTPLVVRRIVKGKVKRKDLVSLQWRRGRGEKRATKPPIPLKALRSVAASLLESHSVYGRCTTLFLGHSPTSIKDKHYAAPPQELFDEAITWLRNRLVE